MFDLVPDSEKNLDPIVRPSINFWKNVSLTIYKDKVAFISMIVVILIIIAAILIPEIMPHKFDDINYQMVNAKPSKEYLFGADANGRDLFVRTFYGTRYSLIIGFVAAFINILIGVIYGGVSGFFGGKIDGFMMRIVDILYSIPLMIYVILLAAIMTKPGESSPEIGTIILALSISYWIDMARIVRGKVLQLKEEEFVLAAQALGAKDFRIIMRHLIPNCMGSIIVTTMLLVPQAIFTEAFLSFLGLGISEPKASLGTLSNSALSSIFEYPHQLFFPSIMICIIILALNLFGDGLRDALDPQMKS